MHRMLAIAALVLVGTGSTFAGDAKQQAIDYVRKLQTSTGGFLSEVPAPNVRSVPNLRATSSAVRALHYLGGEIPDKAACARYVAACYDPKTGGFRDRPDLPADVFSTAVGIMAVTELKMPVQEYAAGVQKFLTENAKTDEDIRIAVAGLERIQGKSSKTQDWLAQIRKKQNEDGTFGEGPGQARATGSNVVILLRLGAEVKQRDAILKAIQQGQRPDGGFGKEDSRSSDLETSYRVGRCYLMLKAQPDVDKLLAFVESCRNKDGGYGIAPGRTSSIGATYFAAILQHWFKK